MNITDVTTKAGRDKKRRRIGRGIGSGCGKTSGRGHKGAGQRSGWKTRGLAEGGAMPFFRRIAKRGFNNANFAVRYTVVNIGQLDERFKAGAHVTTESLVEVGLVRDVGLPIKILGKGEVTKKLMVDAAHFSASAAEKIRGAGGEARVRV